MESEAKWVARRLGLDVDDLRALVAAASASHGTGGLVAGLCPTCGAQNRGDSRACRALARLMAYALAATP